MTTEEAWDLLVYWGGEDVRDEDPTRQVLMRARRAVADLEPEHMVEIGEAARVLGIPGALP